MQRGLRPKFYWWKEFGKHRLVEPQLPFENGRSDLLTGSGSRLDIQNINLLATLFVHAQYQGYWNQLGMQFQEEMEAFARAACTQTVSSMLRGSGRMIQERRRRQVLCRSSRACGVRFEESVRIKKKVVSFLTGTRYQSGHLAEFCRKVQSLLQKYRSELVRQSRLLDQGGRA